MATLGGCALRSLKRVCSVNRLSLYRTSIQRFGATSTLHITESDPQTEKKDDVKEEAREGANQEKQTPEAEQKLQKQVDDLQLQYSESQDKYKRALAESENVRQRMSKQVKDAKLFGIQGFCKELLDVADILSQALESVPADQINNSNPHLKGLHEGLSMTQTQLMKVFNKYGLTKIAPVEGEKFDPHLHEAIFQQATPDGKTPGTVAVITKVGYKLHERTIRAAKVGVYKS